MSTLAGEMRALGRLATPIAAAHLGQVLLGFVDTAVVGRLGETELAAVGIAGAVYFACSITGAGFVLGIDPLISQALGSGEDHRARDAMWQGVWLALAVALPLALLSIAGGYGLEAIGIDPATALASRAYLWARAPAMIPYFVVTALVTYLQAHSRTRPLVISAIVANLLNAPLDGLLVFGDEALAWVGLPPLGLPALGVMGAGLTSTVVTVAQLGVVAWAAGHHHDPSPQAATRGPRLAALRQAMDLGLPIGLQRLAEVGVFSLTALLAGRVSTLAAASHQIAISFAAATFMVPMGISAASAVRVGRAVGARDRHGTRLAGYASLLAGGGFMALGAVLFVLAPRTLASILTNDPEVLKATVPLMRVAAIFQVSDGIQVVAVGALRGLGDTRAALYYNLLGHYAVGVPVALALGFGLDLGAVGLWWGLCAGLTAVAVALTIRFFRRTAHDVTPLIT